MHASMIGKICLVSFIIHTAWSQSEEEPSDAYYGVPLGALHHSADRTKAEMYAADEYTVIFNHFSHSPTKPGCTSVMIGPPRSTDRDAIRSIGVLIPITQPLLTPHTKARSKRNDPFTLFHGFNWPTEFAHLRMDPSQSGVKPQNLNYQPEDAFAGIELHVGSSIDEPAAKDVNIEEEMVSDTSVMKDNHKDDKSQKVVQENGEQTATKAPKKSAQKVTPGTVTSNTTPASTAKPSRVHSVPKAKAAYSTTDARSNVTTTRTTTAKPTTSSVQQATKPIIFFDTKSQTEAAKNREKLELEGPGIVVFNSERITPRPRNVHPSFHGPLARSKEVESQKTTSTTPPSKLPFTRDIITEDGYIAYFGAPQSEVTTDWPRRAPSHRNYDDKPNFVATDKDKILQERKTWSPTTEASTESHSDAASTPLFYVIEDPREQRRRLRAERKKASEQHAQKNTILNSKEHQTAIEIAPQDVRQRFERKYELPVAEDKTVAFTLSHGAKLTDYEWIGLYDQCEDKATPLVSLQGIDPPREEKIDPLSGWKHNISSYRVQILNCNTILIPGFVYNATLAPRGTFIMVGIGRFPDGIEKLVKTTIVGQQDNELKKNYGLEDLMLRLPKSYRTFDIDFISVFNEVEQKTYAYTNVPSLLVPPCSEEA